MVFQAISSVYIFKIFFDFESVKKRRGIKEAMAERTGRFEKVVLHLRNIRRFLIFDGKKLSATA